MSLQNNLFVVCVQNNNMLHVIIYTKMITSIISLSRLDICFDHTQDVESSCRLRLTGFNRDYRALLLQPLTPLLHNNCKHKHSFAIQLWGHLTKTPRLPSSDAGLLVQKDQSHSIQRNYTHNDNKNKQSCLQHVTPGH